MNTYICVMVRVQVGKLCVVRVQRQLSLLRIQGVGLIFHDKNKKGIQINTLVCKKSNRTNKSTSALIWVLKVTYLCMNWYKHIAYKLNMRSHCQNLQAVSHHPLLKPVTIIPSITNLLYKCGSPEFKSRKWGEHDILHLL